MVVLYLRDLAIYGCPEFGPEFEVEFVGVSDLRLFLVLADLFRLRAKIHVKWLFIIRLGEHLC